ncbi:uncharacterized protein LOC123196303 [Mangifera indica]|uniref:uncharacterized protein LOC123196303 n=1 Tax=Mangifera indica TaxID=29780 RepID=UPI001CFC3384|nr:uncharacterized protein LOC123196303 [Mangifera indica]
MAQVSSSYLHLQHELADETLTLDSIPHWSHSEFDIYTSDTELSAPSYSHGQSAVRFHDDVSDSDSLIVNASDLFDHRENQVNFVMDLFQQRVEQSKVIGVGDDFGSGFVSDPLNGSSFGVMGENSEIGSEHLDADFGLGLAFGVMNIRESNDNNSRNFNNVGINDFDCNEDDFFVERRVSGVAGSSCGRITEFSSDLESDDGNQRQVTLGVLNIRESNENNSHNFNNVGINDFDCNEDDFFVERRVSGVAGSSSVGNIEFSADSESDDGNQRQVTLGVLGLLSEDEYVSEGHLDDVTSIGLCWDSLHVEDSRETNEEFEWEEVDDRVDEREIFSTINNENGDENSISLSISPIIAPEDVVSVESVGVGNLEWEVLLNANNLETNPEMDNRNAPYFGDHGDFFHTAEYDVFFGQFAENESAWMGRPPASKAVIANLPLVVLTKVDVESNNAVCAVCKDDIGVGEKAKQLPCTHWYHGDCIIPWLGIRNTCPVCRYELPTDDPVYERWRNQRAARGQ